MQDIIDGNSEGSMAELNLELMSNESLDMGRSSDN